jgi:hypothetical protein
MVFPQGKGKGMVFPQGKGKGMDFFLPSKCTALVTLLSGRVTAIPSSIVTFKLGM